MIFWRETKRKVEEGDVNSFGRDLWLVANLNVLRVQVGR